VCLPHGGGSFPYLAGRIHHGWGVRPECQHLLNGPIDYLRRFYYDTVTHSDSVLSFLIAEVGADRVMLGSDFCFDMGYERPVEVVTRHAGINADERSLILGGNAAALLKL
jgi:aminocarboxymuconate-semialdehyde decarboxylase